MLYSKRVRFAPLRAWMWILLAAGSAACSGAESEPSAQAAPLKVESVFRRGVKADAALVQCDTFGNACSELREGSLVADNAMLKTAASARATLSLGPGKTIEMNENSIVLTGEYGGARTVEIAEGTCLLKHSENGEADQAPASNEIENKDNLIVIAGGAQFQPADDRETLAALRARKDGTATVSVRKGQLLAQSQRIGFEFLYSGETARVAPGEGLDKKAVWMGLDAPVEAVSDEGFAVEKPQAPRGLGTLTARIPGTNDVIAGVRLVSHKVSVSVRDGYARTEIEEEFLNETARVLEGRYAFAVPADASISRLGLWVGEQLVEGEMVERERAASIFRGIVEDSVRPRDPALLEWVSGSEFSLKIFPIMPKSARKIVLAYNQALPTSGDRVSYSYPLSLGNDRTNTIDSFSISINVHDAGFWIGDAMVDGLPAGLRTEDGALRVNYSAEAFTPNGDVHLSYSRRGGEHAKQASKRADVAIYSPKAGEFGAPSEQESAFASIRLRAELPEGMAAPARERRDVAYVIDKSHSQSRETLDAEIRLVLGLIRQMDPDERFLVLACDSACVSYPESGLADVNEKAYRAATSWLSQWRPGGASDMAGALFEASKRLPGEHYAQAVYVGDGSPSAGELSAEAIADMTSAALSAKKVDLRLLGLGRTVDETVFAGLSRRLGAAYEAVSTGDLMENRINSIGMTLRAPVIRDAAFELPAGFHDVYPRTLPSLRLGQDVLLVAKVDGGASGTLTLRGKMGNTDYIQAKSIELKKDAADAQNPLVPRLWAEAKIRELEAAPSKDSISAMVDLSKQFHVMSRHTSLLVLENDRMFAEFGIRRTARTAAERSDEGFMKEPEIKGAGRGPQDEAQEEADASGAVGHMFGTGGLGLSGTGEGGSGIGNGFGSGHGTLSGSHGSKPPSVRMGATTVSGRVPPEIIQRIVRQNFGRFRLCYENGLRNNPELQGRVAVRFVIGRDGYVSNAGNGGSDLPDKGVIACVVRAFSGLAFPQPEGGIVTVVYPIMFSPGDGGGGFSSGGSSSGASSSGWRGGWGWGSPWRSPVIRALRVSHAEQRSPAANSARIEELTKALEKSPVSRKRHEALIRGLLQQGRFYDALSKAQQFADVDPDSSPAQELLAFAAAANGDSDLALLAMDSMVELNVRKVSSHLRAARGFEAKGDEARACAHFRAAAFLSPKSADALAEALRCRARVFDGADAVLSAIQGMENPAPRVVSLRDDLRAGKLPRYEAAAKATGDAFARVRCEDRETGCPAAVVIAPTGTVYSPWTPAAFGKGADPRSVSGVKLSDGTYRTVLVGGDPGARAELELSVLGSRRTFSVKDEKQMLSVLTSVQGISTGFGRF